mmetsp:Transcript_46271/g.51736  ORF Transcript_46271/g.51736 Transcript_46271/m.51736 type:complete len:688 (-) Transcript_46271:99-2162(-)
MMNEINRSSSNKKSSSLLMAIQPRSEIDGFDIGDNKSIEILISKKSINSLSSSSTSTSTSKKVPSATSTTNTVSRTVINVHVSGNSNSNSNGNSTTYTDSGNSNKNSDQYDGDNIIHRMKLTKKKKNDDDDDDDHIESLIPNSIRSTVSRSIPGRLDLRKGSSYIARSALKEDGIVSTSTVSASAKGSSNGVPFAIGINTNDDSTCHKNVSPVTERKTKQKKKSSRPYIFNGITNKGTKKHKRRILPLPTQRTATHLPLAKKPRTTPAQDNDNKELTVATMKDLSVIPHRIISHTDSQKMSSNIVGGDDDGNAVVVDGPSPTVIPARVVSSCMSKESDNSDYDSDNDNDSNSDRVINSNDAASLIPNTIVWKGIKRMNGTKPSEKRKVTPPGLSSSASGSELSSSASASSSMAASVLAASTLSDCANEKEATTEVENYHTKNRTNQQIGTQINPKTNICTRSVTSNQLIKTAIKPKTNLFNQSTWNDNRGVMVHSKKYTFRDKLFDLLLDATSSGNTEVISWSSNGSVFVIHDHARFASEFLPTYFGHNKMRSLDRQLHYWSFETVSPTSINNRSFGGKSWKHPFFQRDRRDLLELITRKKKKSKDPPSRRKHSSIDTHTDDERKASFEDHQKQLMNNTNNEQISSGREIDDQTSRSNSPSLMSHPRGPISDKVESCCSDDENDIII